MKFKIELHPLAEKELTDTFEWYEKRSAGLGVRFINAVNKRFNQLKEYPERYPVKKKNYREVRTEVFPYLIVYEIFKDKQVVFVSYIFHAKRNPKLKYKR
jgi:plasmid stabilization system protein ParE